MRYLADWTASRDVVAWAAQECEWQRSGERSVVWMLDGWDYAVDIAKAGGLPNETDVKRLGGLVEPRKNTGRGWRRVNVRVGWDVKMSWRSVPRAMSNLVAATLEPDEWFREYEEIHPFADGNGRTGNILWNWLRGTLAHPEFPPNLWADPRREAM